MSHDGSSVLLDRFGLLLLLVLSTVVGGGLEMEPATGPEFLWLIAAALAPVVVARRLVKQRTVTVQTLLGAVAAYLQIAVAYAFAFQALDAVTALPLFGVQVPTTSYMYASLTALSTLGYGDLVPVTELGRLVAVSEAIVGQVFLVTFVAMLASRYASRPVSPPDTQRGMGT